MSRFSSRLARSANTYAASVRNLVGLSDAQATVVTSRLYQYLGVVRGRNQIIAGQQVDYNAEGITTENNMTWLYQNTAKLPSIGGFDLMRYTPSRVEHGDSGIDTQRALDWATTGTYSGTSLATANGSHGGIVAFCWHWNAPNGTSAQWYTWTNSNATNFRPASAIADMSAGGGHELLLRDIDAIAVQIKRLRDAGVPVIWRPLHEANNGYFWWGADGAEPFKQLWRLVYDRLVNYHGIHNLIWVWSANWYPNDNYAAWYPGDQYVDICGVDSYDSSSSDHNPLSVLYAAITAVSSKPVAVSECGYIPDPAQMHNGSNDFKWTYFATWSDSDGSHNILGSQNSSSYVNTLYNATNVITRNELPDWQNGTFT